MQKSTFNIYRASAGSGKTFTLVKEYIKILLNSTSQNSFHQILAVTFTNKAVNEMKQRVLEGLSELGQIQDGFPASDLANQLVAETGIELADIQTKAARILQRILHNYAFFEISTIDKFTHRVIRSFAKDLRLSQNFEVVLDTDLLLEEAINNLLSKAGEDAELTRVLIEFSLEKTDSDKSWDLSRDLIDVGKLTFRENEILHLQSLENKSVADFKTLQQYIRRQIRSSEQQLVELGNAGLELIERSGYSETDFPNKTLPNQFKKFRNLGPDLEKIFETKTLEKLQSGNIVKKGVEQPESQLIDGLLEHYKSAKKLIFRRAFLVNIYGNVLPLTILNTILKEIRNIEKERDLLPISSFNKLIASTIINQPAPFIYERLGEKFRHYFIDEFQDTSQMQWNNLIPLISNALESLDENENPGSLMLVGDVKQAIYRWRGGNPEQFLNLIRKINNPFTVEPEILDLKKNYRSRTEIVQFNNQFFKSISSFLGEPTYRQLFLEETEQETHLKDGGFVQIELLDKQNDSIDQLYLDRTISIIKEVQRAGHSLNDICILTRKKEQGALLSEGLANRDIAVTSPDTLMLENNPEVNFLIDLLKHSLDPDDLNHGFRLFSYLIPKDVHFHQELTMALADSSGWLETNWQFDLESFKFKAVYDGFEEAIKVFGLSYKSDAYVSYLLDEVLSLEQKNNTGMREFLDYWELNHHKISISTPANIEAVNIMTIHKAKGLEFPVVIFPYAKTDIYYEQKPKLWVETDPEQFCGFGELLINKNKKALNFGDEIETLYLQDQNRLELDAFNVLYVALTRAIDSLYIISDTDRNSKDKREIKSYTDLLINYLKTSDFWKEEQYVYSFGKLPEPTRKKDLKQQEQVDYQLTTKSDILDRLSIKGRAIWNVKQAEALEKGNLIHYIMSFISDSSNIEDVFETMIRNGTIKTGDRDELRSIVIQLVSHPELRSYFQQDLKVCNEQEIITENGLILRPDRLVFRGKNVIIIDYKTGVPKRTDKEQVIFYGEALEQMGYILEKSVLVYVGDTIKTEFI